MGSVAAPIKSPILLDSLLRARESHESAAYKNAVIYAQKAISLDNKCAEAYSILGRSKLKTGDVYGGLDNMALAVVYDPACAEYKQNVIDWFTKLHIKKLNADLKLLLTDCMESKDVRLVEFHIAWLSLLKNDEEFSEIYKLSKIENYDDFTDQFSKINDLSALLDPFFLTGLGRFIVPVRTFENFMMNLRRLCLDRYSDGKTLFEEDQGNEFISGALSRYAFFTEYVWNETSDETQKVEILKKALEATDKPQHWHLMLYACYRPVWTLKNAKAILNNIPAIDNHVSSIPRTQLADYFVQQDIRVKIPNLTPIEDEVSLAVKSQYEEFPYPAWEALPKGLLSQKAEGRFINKKAKILIAGCGTGQEALQLAASLPDCEMTAIDLSRASISYAVMRAEQLGIKNVKFWNADITALGDHVKDRFDFITSSGVLHHMRDPKAGWKILHGLLKPGGLMRIALYSRTARASVIEARKIIAEKGISNDAQSIRDFRTGIANLIDNKYIEFFERTFDYYTLNMCRDLLFHVQEHQFDFLQIDEILKEFDLRFLDLQITDETKKKFKAMFRKEQDFYDLSLWEKFEQKNPYTFAAMYCFWCEKSA